MTERDEARGLQRIGSLVDDVSSLQDSKDYLAPKSGRPVISSATTGLPSPVNVALSSTGVLPGEIGSGDTWMIELAEMDSRDVDASLREWLPRSIASRMTVLERWEAEPLQNTADDPGDPTCPGYVEYPTRDVEKSLRVLRLLGTSADQAFCEREVGRLRLVVATGRDEDQDDIKARVAVVAEELTAYPPDVVRSACRSLGQSAKWFPSLAEITEACDWRVRRRRLLLRALERYASR